jgi:hypothetical protein
MVLAPNMFVDSDHLVLNQMLKASPEICFYLWACPISRNYRFQAAWMSILSFRVVDHFGCANPQPLS